MRNPEPRSFRDAAAPRAAGSTPSAHAGPRARTPGWRVAFGLAGLALVALHLAVFVPRNVSLQWDARIYFDAARAAWAGLDPYRLESLVQVSGGRPHALPFLYPPVTLPLFLPFTTVPPATALAVWMGFQLVALVALVVLWKRLAPHVEWLPLALVAVFGFGGAGSWALRSGNIALVEALLVWAGLAAFAAGHRVRFAALVVAAACFKLAPAGLLLLLLVPAGGARPRPGLLAAALGALTLLVWAPGWMPPASGWIGFTSALGAPFPSGAANPSVTGLALAWARGAGHPEPVASTIAIAAWAVTVVLVLAASAGWLRRAWRADDPKTWVFAAAWGWVLLEPRPMSYGWIAMAAVPLCLAPRPFTGPAGRWALALVLSAQGLSGAAHVMPDSILMQHAPALLALALWLLVVQGRPAEPATAR